MTAIKHLVEISKYAGERFDLVQAAGGNSSVKLDNGEMLIKASGFLLSDVTEDTGYSRVVTKDVAAIVDNEAIISSTDKRHREALTGELLRAATLDKKNRPSIETLLHSLLLKYTLHTHSVVVNMIVAQPDCEAKLREIFADVLFAFVPYETPGIELAIVLKKALQQFDATPGIIILQNHGLIVTSDDIDDITKLTEYVIEKIETHLHIDMSKYKLTNAVSRLYNTAVVASDISYLCEDVFLNEQLQRNPEVFNNTPFCPDTFVYCSTTALRLHNLSDTQPILDYQEKHHELPKVILYNGKLFFIASSLKKAREMEEVLKFHIMVLAQNGNNKLNFLPTEELHYLGNWEAEKYRQKL